MDFRLDRLELKFLVSSAQRDRLTACFRQRLDGDPNLAGRSNYPVSTLYFDSEDLRCYLERVLESNNRRKFRIRLYGSANDSIPPACFLEIKQNQQGRIGKRRIAVSREWIRQFEENLDLHELFEIEPALTSRADLQILREARQMVETYSMRPVCLVRYDRLAFQGREAEASLRITVDSNLRYQLTPSRFWFDEPASEVPLLDGEHHLLEVKTTGTLPCWLTRLLNEESCQVRSFSKYCQTIDRRPKLEELAHV